MSGSFIVANLGCKANEYDAQQLHQSLVDAGWTPAEATTGADLVVINSCTVTDEADRQSRKTAGRLSRRNPDARVVITGCAAEISPERIASDWVADAVVGNQDKHRFLELIQGIEAPGATGAVLGGAREVTERRPRHDPEKIWPDPAGAFRIARHTGRRTRAHLKVQEGCDAFCTFCIIPHARGPARSMRPRDLLRQAQALEESGARELVLTGTAIDAYGEDLGQVGLEDLVELLLRETGIPRIRLGSLDPPALTPRLLEIMGDEPRLCPHFHVSLQSPHSGVLRRMKRRYDGGEVADRLWAIDRLSQQLRRDRGPAGAIFVGMDLIAGFPGEDPGVYQWTRDRLLDLPWSRLHVFPYSERSGTAATRLDGAVAPHIRKSRVRELIRISTNRLGAWMAEAAPPGAVLEVLVEGGTGEGAPLVGRTSNYIRVEATWDGEPPARNTHVRIRIAGRRCDVRSGDVKALGSILR